MSRDHNNHNNHNNRNNNHNQHNPKTEKHFVRRHFWQNGILQVIDEEFESVEDAMLYLMGNTYASAKMFNEKGEVVHQVGAATLDTYA